MRKTGLSIEYVRVYIIHLSHTPIHFILTDIPNPQFSTFFFKDFLITSPDADFTHTRRKSRHSQIDKSSLYSHTHWYILLILTHLLQVPLRPPAQLLLGLAAGCHHTGHVPSPAAHHAVWHWLPTGPATTRNGWEKKHRIDVNGNRRGRKNIKNL